VTGPAKKQQNNSLLYEPFHTLVEEKLVEKRKEPERVKEKEQGKKRIEKEDVQRKSVEDVVDLINILKSFKHN